MRGLFSVLSVQEKAQQEAIAKAYRASSASSARSGGSGGGGGGGGGGAPKIDPVAPKTTSSFFPSPTKSASQTIIDQFGRGPLNNYNKKRKTTANNTYTGNVR